ncbi:hypothetical protein B0T17DRAFT_498804 [Bombardia bombarda]|uniref:Pre-rrna processing protein n=1 Tax=Bombardia bombarda TaxID=252184 RepID=A0AA39TZT6_9PEZI|nr:hypothetical protein B0T17DRAFT_498804 [Bombardia bombarda]
MSDSAESSPLLAPSGGEARHSQVSIHHTSQQELSSSTSVVSSTRHVSSRTTSHTTSHTLGSPSHTFESTPPLISHTSEESTTSHHTLGPSSHHTLESTSHVWDSTPGLISYTSESTPQITSRTSESNLQVLESTPLLSSSNATPRYDGGDDDADVASIASSRKSKKSKRSISPSVVAVLVLSLLSIAIIVVAFFVPAAVEEYAKEAAVLEPTNLSLESITADGVRARIQANFRLDGQRVKNEHVRRVGKAATWLVRSLATAPTRVNVYLPEYNNILLGAAGIPSLTVSIVDGDNTPVDIIADLIPGEAEGIRAIANEWLEGRLDALRLQGKADIQLKTGFIPLGTHSVSETLTFEANKLPQLPAYNITKLNFQEKPIPGHDEQAMAAEVSINAFNLYPVSVDVPELGFEVLVPGCDPLAPYILVAVAVTSPVAVRPHTEVVVDVHGLVKELPKDLTHICPNSGSSPLDMFFKKYMEGEEATVFVRGQNKDSESPVAPDTPDWISDILSSITVPVAFPGRSFDNLIRSFSLTDVHFTMPDPFAEPGDPDGDPKVSGTIEVMAALPSEMNFGLNVTHVRADADVFYHGKKLGELNLSEWQKANSTQLPVKKDREAMLKINSRIKDAPLNVTDADVLTDVMQALLFGGREVILGIKALVDVEVQTILGQLVVKGVPAEGKIPLKPLGKDITKSLAPRISDIQVIDTTSKSITLKATVNVSNPTPYSAHIPWISLHVLCNGTVVGEALAENLDITTGNNSNLVVSAVWNPSMGDDKKGPRVGRDLLSQYISGFNTTVTIKTHRGSIPSQPALGEALSRLNITIAAPKIKLPGGPKDGDGGDEGGDGGKDKDGDGGQPHFIRDATFHVFSSTATFTLVSPLQHNTLYIDHVNATALYNHTEPVGRIVYDTPFAAEPGESQTPKLPVEWSLDSVGYEKMREALGGRLKLDARAVVGVRVGRWRERVWYVGRGIGASVRI